jgi:hypothetical protein
LLVSFNRKTVLQNWNDLASLHRSQIFREFVSDAGSGRGILRLRRTIPLLFREKILIKDSLFQFPARSSRTSQFLHPFFPPFPAFSAIPALSAFCACGERDRVGAFMLSGRYN